MGKGVIVLTLLLAVGAFVYYKSTSCCHKKVDVAPYRVDGYFGKAAIKAGQAAPKDNPAIRPFKVNVPEADLVDLKSRLSKARYVDHIEGTHFNYGFNSNFLKKVVTYWQTKYDWKKEEAKLNAVPQFVTQIEGIDVHFLHVKPAKKAKTVVPLLISHGWPGSVLEYYKTIPLLTEPDENGVAFELIIPSIPGYGFSEAPHQQGFDGNAAARVFVKLMKRLGHEKFYVHGGDWGNLIVRLISIIFPENVIGAHILGNWEGINHMESGCYIAKVLLAQYFPSLFFSAETRDRDYAKLFPLKDRIFYLLQESGYMHIQATKPDTVGAALVDSPVGLAAYILEKFSTWTNPAYRDRDDGGLTEKFTLDELLTNIMIYWTSGNIASSQRFYKENLARHNPIANAKLTVPAATVDTPHEMVRTPRKLVEHAYTNLVSYSEFPVGGHFTAFEEPVITSNDIRSFVHKVIEQQEQAKRDQQAKQQKKVKDEV